jgi:hypothetical protein
MTKQRCQGITLNSFLGNFLCEPKVSQDHFLKRLSEMVDRDRSI